MPESTGPMSAGSNAGWRTERHGTRKTGARPLFKHRRVFQGTARRRGGAEAVEGRSTAKEIVPVIPGRAPSREPGI